MAIATGCSKQEPSIIKIGLLMDVTGPMGPGGIDMERGARLAFEQAGDIAGKKVELIMEDAATDAGVALDKTKKLVETNKVAAIIGPVNGAGDEAVAPYMERVHVPQLDGMGATRNAVGHDWTFVPLGICEQITYAAGIYAHDVLHYNTAVTLGTDFVAGHEFIDGFKMGFEARGGKVIQQTWFPMGTTNMIPFMTALKKADVVAFWGVPADVFAFYPQYRELNIKMPVIQPEDGGVTSSPAMLEKLGKSAVGTVVGSTYLYNTNNPGNKEFVEAYKAKYHQLPGVMSGCGYAHAQLVIAALKATNGNVSSDVLYKALKAVSVDTVRGHLSFPADQGGFGLVVNYPATMCKIGPNNEIEQIQPTYNAEIHMKDGQFWTTLIQ
jgi:branched-chain amino acid transport system substrate-binding protein